MTISPYQAACEAADYLTQFGDAPKLAIVLGSGLGEFGTQLHDATTIHYDQIPHFSTTNVKGHAGVMVIGKISPDGPRVIAMRGRSHLYEGHPVSSIVHPTRTLWKWGVKGIIYTNAAGAIHPKLQPGDLMLITDHINFTGQNPLSGPNDSRFGPRFLDMTQAYDRDFLSTFYQSARAINLRVQKGIYLSLMGPSYETPAEINAYAEMGAYAVGMSTVLSVIAARHVGLRVGGISCITNFGAGITPSHLSHDEVKETAHLVRNDFIELLRHGMTEIHQTL